MVKKLKYKAPSKGTMSIHLHKRLREGIFICTVSLSFFLLLALSTYHRSDPSWSHVVNTHHVSNLGGRAGAWFADIFLYAFGYLAFLFPVLMMAASWMFLREKLRQQDKTLKILRLVGFILILPTACGLVSLELYALPAHLPYSAGGILGDLIGLSLASNFNLAGTLILLAALFLSGVTLFTGVSWLMVLEKIGHITLYLLQEFISLSITSFSLLKNGIQKALSKRKQNKLTQTPVIDQAKRVEPQVSKAVIAPLRPAQVAVPAAVSVAPASPEAVSHLAPKQSDFNSEVSNAPSVRKMKVPEYDPSLAGTMPPVSLLDPAEIHRKNNYSNSILEEKSREVEQRLADFGVVAQVVAVHPGPVITRYELQLAPGVKVSKIVGLAKDLARSLSVISVRVVDVIPGKTVIGIELPNEYREIVRLSEVISSRQYEQANSPVSLSLGKDIAGHPVVVDLAKMPHLLVAGTTGSGKSVGLNAMLLSILYKSPPKEVRLILIDPKMLELSMYDGIPHLLTPVVTDMREAAQSLHWCVAEMERRYRLMAAVGVRNLASYNKVVKGAIECDAPMKDPLWNGPPEEEAPELEELPMIVVVIDELADMMMVVGKKVEQLIARIAQKARAAGIHMILATQRPSVDVLTGLIKSNVPTRISFQVSSKIDSRTILDQQGAEQLLGHGDMLYLAPGCGAPVRVHGAFVDDHEVRNVTNAWKQRGKPDYIETFTDLSSETNPNMSLFGMDGGSSDEESDPLYDQAVAFITSTRRASISSIQRRFKIGYNRAARIIEVMESSGVVSPMESNGSREVLAPPPPEE